MQRDVQLQIDAQGERPCIWAVVDPGEPRESREFTLVGTGHPFSDRDGEHLGTFTLRGGAFVGHLFGRR